MDGVLALAITIGLLVFVVWTVDTLGTVRREQRALAEVARRLEAKLDALSDVPAGDASIDRPPPPDAAA